MLHSTNVVALHAALPARPSFVQLHVAPLWQRTSHVFVVAAEVWRDARALERQLMPRRISDA